MERQVREKIAGWMLIRCLSRKSGIDPPRQAPRAAPIFTLSPKAHHRKNQLIASEYLNDGYIPDDCTGITVQLLTSVKASVLLTDYCNINMKQLKNVLGKVINPSDRLIIIHIHPSFWTRSCILDI